MKLTPLPITAIQRITHGQVRGTSMMIRAATNGAKRMVER
jgi:hypothetical protein